MISFSKSVLEFVPLRQETLQGPTEIDFAIDQKMEAQNLHSTKTYFHTFRIIFHKNKKTGQNKPYLLEKPQNHNFHFIFTVHWHMSYLPTRLNNSK